MRLIGCLFLLPILPTDSLQQQEWKSFLTFAESEDWVRVEKEFLLALGTRDEAKLHATLEKMIEDNKSRGVELLLNNLKVATTAQYWNLLGSLGRFTDDSALGLVVQEILTGKNAEKRRDLVIVLRLSSAPIVPSGLLRVLKEGPLDLQVSVLDELVDRGQVAAIPAAIDLVADDVMERRELTRRVFKAIKALVKEEPRGNPSMWKSWWETRGRELQLTEATRKKATGTTVFESVTRTRITDCDDLKKGSKEEIVVVEGAYDSVQDVLTTLGVPHTLLAIERIKVIPLTPKTCFALYVNCGSGDWSKPLIDKVRSFVEQGGYLFVTDLGMQGLVRHAFPGFLDHSKGTFTDLVVDIVPWRGSIGHPFLRGISIPVSVRTADRLKWRIDDQGPSIAFDPRKVIPLIDAPALAEKKRPTAVAVTFAIGGDQKRQQEAIATGGVYEELRQQGGGKVLCVLSHFSKQQLGDDGFALQNLLLNFLIEARDQKLFRESK